MIDFITNTIFWVAVFWLVIKIWEKYLIARNIILQEELKEMTNKIKNNFICVDIEKHDNMFYLYEKDTREFIAQGSNFEEVKQRCENRFKGKSVVANEEQMEQLGLK
jgi:hypothetical protein